MNARITVCALVALVLAFCTLVQVPFASAQSQAYVVEFVRVDVKQFAGGTTLQSYAVRVTNQGPALRNAAVYLESVRRVYGVIDNEILLGDLPAGVTVTSRDKFIVLVKGRKRIPDSRFLWSIEGDPSNTGPVANAGADQTVPLGQTVTLDGSASTDADGDSLTYRWRLVSVPANSNATLSSTSQVRPTMVVDKAGDYVVELIVNDGQLDSAADTVRISTLNSGPQANAGPDRTVARGARVTLDGSASFDPDGDALNYAWELIERPAGSATTLSDATSVTPSLQLDTPGRYRAQLVVNDGRLSSSPDEVTISTENSVPQASAGPDRTGTVGETLALDGSASADADGDALAFVWSLTARPSGSNATLSAADTPAPGFTPDVAGLYVVQLIVNDGLANSAPDTATVTIRIANRAPDAVDDAVKTPRDTSVLVAVLANDSDPDAGDTLTVTGVGSPSSGTAVIEAGAVRYTPAPGFEGATSFTYSIADVAGASDSATVTVTVQAPNRDPVANAGPDQTVTAGTLVALDGSASTDPDGDPLTFLWEMLTRPTGSSATLAGATTQTPGFNADRRGLYTLRLTVSDGRGGTVTDDVAVTATNRAPVAVDDTAAVNAGASVLIPVLVNDTDADGDALSITTVGAPAQGTATIEGSSIRYAAPLGYVGSAAFAYSIADGQGGVAEATVSVTVNVPPVAPQVTTPPQDATVRVGESATFSVVASGSTPLSYQWLRNDAAITGATNASYTTPPAELTENGARFAVTVSNAAGNVTSAAATLTVQPADNLPLDPSKVAPPNDPTVGASVFAATRFLYAGNNPIQTGVAQGAVDPKRVAVLRGRVIDRNAAPLSGVKISIEDHPEFGQTLSRADGWFDLAVNGGGILILKYELNGRLPVQRQLTVPWRDFVVAPDVVLVELDAQVTTITSGAAEVQVARASAVTDGDGTRQATMLVPPATTASMVMPDGSVQPLSSFQFRATEYTVGSRGPNAMPADLPANSGYTYAIEFSADEAIAGGAARVQFSQPLVSYVENFLGFPVGTAVPAGYYDRDAAKWVPSDNGRVIRITGVTGGLATVDSVGSGNLPPLVLSDAERGQLAQLYSVGQQLWRVSIPHFTPWDYNWPYGPPADGRPPRGRPRSGDPDDDCLQNGSIIGCLSQTLAEQVPITGTDLFLRYGTDRAAGRRSAYTIDIPLSDDTLPASLRRIELEVQVAGRVFTRTFDPSPNQSYRYTWDGIDVYGRRWPGAANATVRVGYVYDAVYQAGSTDFQRSFGAFGGSVLTSNRTRQEVTAWLETDVQLGVLSAPIGGWTLSAHHAYLPQSSTLLLGDGTRRSAAALRTELSIAAGRFGDYSGSGCNGFEGLPATLVALNGVLGIAVGPDGSVYFFEACFTVRRILPDGTVVFVAGQPGFSNPAGATGDGGPATQALLAGPRAVAVGPDGSVYIADANRIRRVGPDGIIQTIAGTGVAGAGGDGGPALQAQLNAPSGLAVSPDGSVYVADLGNRRVRVIRPDGTIATIAGNGDYASSGDGGKATQARLQDPIAVAVGPDGSIYVSEISSHRVRRIGVDGIIRTVAGTGVAGFFGDGGPATLANLYAPRGIAVADDGAIYIAEEGNKRIRYVSPDGTITTIAGSGSDQLPWGFAGVPTRANLTGAKAVAVAPDGKVYFNSANGMLAISSVLPNYAAGEFLVPAADARVVYGFDSAGRHLKTFDGLTGATLRTFGYDAAARLITIDDGQGKVTRIERDGAGDPTAIVAPGGQRTALTLGPDGRLTRVENPAGEAVQFTYLEGGLLATMTDALGGVHRFAYDDQGRLIRDEDPAGGVQTLVRTEQASGYAVAHTSQTGHTISYAVERLPTGEVRRTNRDRQGAPTQVTTAPDSKVTVTYPDGTVETITQGPDPRFGMAVSIPERITRTTPGGRVLTVKTRRDAVLDRPGDPFSFGTLSDTTEINGRTFTGVYDSILRTLTSTSPANRKTVAKLDARGRVVSKRLAPTLDPVTVEYDARGRIVSLGQGAQRFTFDYDAADRIVGRTDATGRRTQYAWDAADRLTQTTLPSGRTYGYTYDANGRRTQVRMPDGGVHTFTYTALDAEASYAPPGNASFQRIYEADRALARVTLPGGREVQSTYDAVGRNTGYAFPEATISVGYANDDPTERPSVIRRAPVAQGTSQELVFGYDGPLVTSTGWNGAAAGQYSYTYDNNFLLAATQLVSGGNTVQIALTRDADELITGYGPFTFTRDGPGGALSEVRDANLLASYTYDTMGRITARTQTVAGQAVYDAQVTYDAFGQVTRKIETIGGTSSTYDYGYDPDGQLVQVTRDGTVIERYQYDANGNRTSRKLGVAAAEAAAYDGQDRLQQRGAIAYQFDIDGFLARRGADTFSYSARGELLEATVGGQTVVYSYDGAGRRTARTTSAGTTQYLYGDPHNSMLLTAVRSEAGVLTTLYYDDAGLLVGLERGGSLFYVATDQVGTPRRVTNASGQTVKALEYDAFGNVVADSAPAFDLPLGFAGGLADPLTGLTLFGFRDYDLAAGRWAARDPVGFDAGQGNLFAYVGSDPINLRDPLGLWCVGASGYVGIGGGAKFCCTWRGCSACVEVGLGLGAKLQVGAGGRDRTGAKVGGELSAKCGPAGIGVGASLDDRGCAGLEVQGEFGPEKFKGYSGGLEGDNLNVSKGVGKFERDVGAGCSVQGKVAASFCKGK